MLSKGDALSHYRLAERLGDRTKGDVWKAVDTRSDRQVTVRILSFAADSSRMARCRDDARALAEIEHPGIAPILDVDSAAGHNFLVTGLVTGTPLTELIAPRGLPVERILELALPFAAALCAAHDREVIHGDLKPINIVVDVEGTLRILDFGLRSTTTTEPLPDVDPDDVPTETMSQEGTLGLETLPYASPERIQYRPLDHRSDVYSAGAILYELATGQAPFVGESVADVIVAVLRDAPRSITELAPGVPDRLEAVIRRALGKDRRRRLQSARFLHEDLLRLADEIGAG